LSLPIELTFVRRSNTIGTTKKPENEFTHLVSYNSWKISANICLMVKLCAHCGEESKQFSVKQQKLADGICRSCQTYETRRRLDKRKSDQIDLLPALPPTEELGSVRHPKNWGYSDYVDRVMGLKCFVDLVNLRVFPSAKDISESMGAIMAANKYGNIPKRARSDCVCLCIGDGATPRTATLSCYLNSWRCYSIDPELSQEWVGFHPTVRGLHGTSDVCDAFFTKDIVQFDGSSPLTDTKHLVLLLVHSHARLIGPSSLTNIRKGFGGCPTSIVAIPCCARFRPTRDIGEEPHQEFIDHCIFSDKRTVMVWNFDRQDPVRSQESRKIIE